MEQLLYLTLGGSALALLLMLLRLLLKTRLSSTVYYYAWLLVLLRFALPLPGLIPTGAEPAQPVQAVQSTGAETPAPLWEGAWEGVEAPLPEQETLPAASPQQGDQPAPIAPAAAESAEAPAPQQALPSPAARPRLHWEPEALLRAVWLAGTALALLVTLTSYLRFTARLRPTLRDARDSDLRTYAALGGRRAPLYRSAQAASPLTYGLFAPKIVLPERDYDEEMLRNILRHELTHFRRFDMLYKWLALAVLATQWFNPVAWLARREINRACELSCDEWLLRGMTREEKQSYGETLLTMASERALPAGVAATSFSTEKKSLKERLEQIMHFKHTGMKLLASLLALVLLAGCGAAAGPQAAAPEQEAEPTPAAAPAESAAPAGNEIRVTTVDELLEAIAPDTTIRLAAGDYDLSTASTYGGIARNAYWSWQQTYDGVQLVIANVKNLTLIGEGADSTAITAVPRYAHVLDFQNCEGLSLSGFTAGHSKEPGLCVGGVLHFSDCKTVSIADCGLYGCGVVGVWADNCRELSVLDSAIYSCSNCALWANACRALRVQGCEIYDCGASPTGFSVFLAEGCSDLWITGNEVHDNSVGRLLTARSCSRTLFLSNRVHNNALSEAMFELQRYPATVDGCVFEENTSEQGWFCENSLRPLDAAGQELDGDALAAMPFALLDPAPLAAVPAASEGMEIPVGGEVSVKNVDELLAALGSDRTIYLEPGVYDLSAAAGYDVAGECYDWIERFDGPELEIYDVENLTICGAAESPAAVTIAAVPRYVNVLHFNRCEGLSLIGLTLGHTEEPGYCSGGVLFLEATNGVSVEDCRLYGCGTLGVEAVRCTGIALRRAEIYDCSSGGVLMHETDGVSFEACDIHDVPSPALSFSRCGDLSWNGAPFPAPAYESAHFDLVDGEPVLLTGRPSPIGAEGVAVQELPPAPEPRAEDSYSFGDAVKVLELIAEARKVGLLGEDEGMAFDPNANFDPDSEILVYFDNTILAICWKEIIDGNVCSFSEVKVADATQFRRKLAGDQPYFASTYPASQLAGESGAVVAMNADNYITRDLGVLIYDGLLFNASDAPYDAAYTKANCIDTLCISVDGDFLFYPRGAGESADERLNDWMVKNRVRFSLAYGPILVRDGQLQQTEDYPLGEINKGYSRAGIGQMDRLHYLYMCVSHSPEAEARWTVAQFAQRFAEKGVREAYCLEGGQTAELLFRSEPYNAIDFGAERSVGDLLCFVSGLPADS